MLNNKTKIMLLIAVALLAAASRLVEHPYNFTPLGAMLLFFGAYFNRRYLLVPLLALAISDLFIGLYDWRLMLAVYGSFALIGLLGRWLKQNKNIISLASLPILSAIIFFLITNGAVWLFSDWYAKSFKGLLYCYFLGLPFLKNTMLGNLFYSAVFFLGYQAVIYLKQPMSKFSRLKGLINRQ